MPFHHFTIFEKIFGWKLKIMAKSHRHSLVYQRYKDLHLGESEFLEIDILKPVIKNEGTMLSKANHSVSCVYFVIAVKKCLCKFHLQKSENRLKSVLFAI